MQKSIISGAYRKFLTRLKDARKTRGLTQAQLAERLGESQSWVSKCERGERRLDVLETKAFCEAIGLSFVDFLITVFQEGVGTNRIDRGA